MTSNAKQRHEILTDILRDAKKHPKNWNAVIGRDQHLLSDDYYLFHPNIGLYLLKEYNKNPYQRKGVGGRIGRKVDDHIADILSTQSSDFGIIHGDIRKIAYHLNKGARPQEIINAAIEGKNMGISLPVRGHASAEENSFRYLRNELSSKQQPIEKKLKKLAEDDGLYTSY